MDFVTAGVSEEPAGNFTITRSVNTGSAANRFLFMWLSAQHAAVLATAYTYAGVSLTPFTDGNIDGWGITWRVRFFYLPQPASGSNNLVGTFDWDGVKLGMGWAVYSSDVGELTVGADESGNGGVTTDQISTVASAVGQHLVGIHIQADDGTPTNAHNSPTVEDFEGFTSATGWHMQAGHAPGAAPNASLSWTSSLSQPYVFGSISLIEGGVTGGPPMAVMAQHRRRQMEG